jgi:RNA polymerase sigma-70 factor (ECF subfamily)
MLVRQVRAGDAQAAAQLVRCYEPALLRQIRMELTDPRLRRLIDSVDVCQSVLGNFFIRLATGQLDLESPTQLYSLLATMAHHRILNHARDQHAGRRDVRRVIVGDSGVLNAVADPADSPSQVVVYEELLRQALAELTPEERALADQRATGLSWDEIAQAQGESAEAVRKRLTRALDRVTRLLGLGDQEDV